MMKRTVMFVLSVVFALVGYAELARSASSQDIVGDENPRLLSSKPEVFKVKLDKPRRVVDARGAAKTFKEAYMIRLEVKMPPPGGTAVRFALGEEPIDEYGSWKHGIYFWVYDEAELENLNGGVLRAKFRGEFTKLGALQNETSAKLKSTSQRALRDEAMRQ
ncbi:MAG: hypothetical protein AAFQ82_13585 [Myxococcota bacterium]